MASVRAKAGEKLSDPILLQKVLDLLEQDKPITKKAACEMLNISYNTARLTKILEVHTDSQTRQANRRKQLRSVPVSNEEKRDIINSYLAGDALTSISEDTFRSINVIKNVLVSYNIPLRNPGANYFNPLYIEDSSNDYKKDDLVYSARYNCPAYIRHRVNEEVFSIWTTGDHAQQALQPYYELADLRDIQKELGIEIKGIGTEEYNRLIIEARDKSKKGKKNDR